MVDMTKGPNYKHEIARFKSLDNAGKYSGVVLFVMYRNIHFPQQWLFTSPAYPGAGRSYNDLVDEVQLLQKHFRQDGSVPAGPSGSTAIQHTPVVYNNVFVKVINARNLPAMDSNGFSDGYCLVKGGKDKKKLLKTKVVKKSLNPDWNEGVQFSFVEGSAPKAGLLTFKVYDHDTFGSDDKIGKVSFTVPAAAQLVARQEYTLPIVNKKGANCGTLTFILEKL